MPGITELEQLSKSYSLAIGILVIACVWLLYGLVRLYRENQQLYGRIETLLGERVKTLENLLAESYRGGNRQ